MKLAIAQANRASGTTLLISPLLAVMRNQLVAAERIGVRAATTNSSNLEEWQLVPNHLLAGEIGILLISPQLLANDEFREKILLSSPKNRPICSR